jgi:4-hydroxybenzoate polyprenyltransferase
MRALDALFALRPMVLVPAWSFFLLGYGASPPASHFPSWRFLLFTLAMIGVHLANQVADRETDRINDKAYFLQRGIFSTREYVVAAAACLAIGLGLAWVRRESPALLSMAVALGLAYSVPPLRFSARPGLDLVANALGYGVVAPLLGAGGGLTLAFLACTACAVGAVFTHTTLLDLEGDRRTGKRTVGVALGEGTARCLAAALAAGAAVSAWFGAPWTLRIASVALAVACIAATPGGGNARLLRAPIRPAISSLVSL